MKTKLVYVLTSDLQDYFLEMSLMSVWTARHHNPDAQIELVTDEFTMQTCQTGMRKEFLSHFSDVKVIDTSGYDTKGKRSRYLKTTLRNIVEGDYLFIDSDTVICESLEEIDNVQGLMAMEWDEHLDKEDDSIFFQAQNKSLYGRDIPISHYYNSGVSLVKDCEETRSFFKIWHEEWKKALSTGVWFDQPPFYRTLLKTDFQIEKLDGTWNCMLWGCCLPYIHNAKIIHTSTQTFKTYPYKTNDPKTLEAIRAYGGLSDEIKRVLLNPKGPEAFNKYDRIITIDDKKYKMLTVDVVNQSYYLYNNSPRSLKALRFAMKWILRNHAYTEWVKNKWKNHETHPAR